MWQVQTAGKVESSPVVVDGIAYFGSHDGRFFAVSSDTGRIRWAYQTGGRINASPSVFGGRVCVTTYAGSFVCLDRGHGRGGWTTYLKRDAFRYESFYASPSSDGERLYSLARSGALYALDASSGRVVWRAGVGGLGHDPRGRRRARVRGRIRRRLRAFRATSGDELWSTWVGGRILGAPVVIGPYVFFSTLEKRTFALRVEDGSVAWRLPLGKYAPGIATEHVLPLAERPADRDTGSRRPRVRLTVADAFAARAAIAGRPTPRHSRRRGGRRTSHEPVPAVRRRTTRT